uniref:DUF1122 domain-containing protein n=1 Tax=Ignisphaera aggregans TaxID=334771 RepID=A0A7J3Z7Y2_9CREN
MICREVFNSIKIFSINTVEKRGRFPEEKSIEIYIGYRNLWHRLLVIKVFEGRLPFYRKWVEVFSIMATASFDDVTFKFAGSDLEKNLIKCLSNLIDAGERLFIEYLYDRETWKALELSVPPHLTRLGFMLLENGFTWFKDWYYPEGFMEGNPKLQVEKPASDETRRRHLEGLCREAVVFANSAKAFIESNIYKEIFEGVYNRIEKLLNNLCAEQSVGVAVL